MGKVRRVLGAALAISLASLGCSDVSDPAGRDARIDPQVIPPSFAETGGSVCISTNGVERQQVGNSYCSSEGPGDRAVNVNGKGQFVLAGGGPDEPSSATGRNGSGAWAQRNGVAEAVNNSYASALINSKAEAADDSHAEADNHSEATATDGSSAIARTNSVAIAKDGGCAYATGSPTVSSVAVAGAGETVIVVNGSPAAACPVSGGCCRTRPPR